MPQFPLRELLIDLQEKLQKPLTERSRQQANAVMNPVLRRWQQALPVSALNQLLARFKDCADYANDEGCKECGPESGDIKLFTPARS